MTIAFPDVLKSYLDLSKQEINLYQNINNIHSAKVCLTVQNFSENILRPPSLYFQRGSLTYCIVTFQCGFFYVNFSLVMKNSEQLFSELLFSEHFISDQSRWSSRPLVLFSLGGRTKELFVEECF